MAPREPVLVLPARRRGRILSGGRFPPGAVGWPDVTAGQGSVRVGCRCWVRVFRATSAGASRAGDHPNISSRRFGRVTGDIDHLCSPRMCKLINPLATIYTAGTQATTIGDLMCRSWMRRQRASVTTSAPPSPGPPQYSVQGGNVRSGHNNDIADVAADGSMVSSKELPANWLYRRGSLDRPGRLRRGEFRRCGVDFRGGSTLANFLRESGRWAAAMCG